MARAMAAGVIVVAAMGNETTEDPDDALAIWTGICGIGATLHDGSLTEYTNWGNGLLTTALGTVLTRDTSPVVSRRLTERPLRPRLSPAFWRSAGSTSTRT